MSKISTIVELVRRLRPGDRIDIDLRYYEGEAIYARGFTTADWVMESIVGSAYEWSYTTHPATRLTTFTRLPSLLDGDSRTYVSPDRREHFDQLPNGLYRRKEKSK